MGPQGHRPLIVAPGVSDRIQTHPPRSRAARRCPACSADRDVPPPASFTPIRISLPWPPSVNHVWRAARDRDGRVFVRSSEIVRRWRATAKVAVLMQRVPRRAIEVPVSLSLKFCPPHDHRTHDLDNLLKPVLDLLVRMAVLADDRVVDEIYAARLAPSAEPKVDLVLAPCSWR